MNDCTGPDGCDDIDAANGFISSHPPQEMATATGPMMSSYTCGTTACMYNTRSRVREFTGRHPKFYEFATAQTVAHRGADERN